MLLVVNRATADLELRTIEGSGNRARRFDDWGRPRVRRSEILPSQPEVLPSTEWD